MIRSFRCFSPCSSCSVFNPLLRWIETAVNRYIYRQDYDPAQVQEEVSLFLRSLAPPPALATGFVQRVRDRMGIETVSLAYGPKETDEYLMVATDGVEQRSADVADGVRALAAGQGSPYHHGISRGEVTTNPLFREKRAVLLAVFERWRTELLVPLVFERQVRGFVSYGAEAIAQRIQCRRSSSIGHFNRPARSFPRKWTTL